MEERGEERRGGERRGEERRSGREKVRIQVKYEKRHILAHMPLCT
jgi:hypothetical protein